MAFHLTVQPLSSFVAHLYKGRGRRYSFSSCSCTYFSVIRLDSVPSSIAANELLALGFVLLSLWASGCSLCINLLSEPCRTSILLLFFLLCWISWHVVCQKLNTSALPSCTSWSSKLSSQSCIFYARRPSSLHHPLNTESQCKYPPLVNRLAQRVPKHIHDLYLFFLFFNS